MPCDLELWIDHYLSNTSACHPPLTMSFTTGIKLSGSICNLRQTGRTLQSLTKSPLGTQFNLQFLWRRARSSICDEEPSGHAVQSAGLLTEGAEYILLLLLLLLLLLCELYSYAQKKLSGLETKDWVIADRLTPILEQLMCIYYRVIRIVNKGAYRWHLEHGQTVICVKVF